MVVQYEQATKTWHEYTIEKLLPGSVMNLMGVMTKNNLVVLRRRGNVLRHREEVHRRTTHIITLSLAEYGTQKLWVVVAASGDASPGGDDCEQ